MIIGDVNLIPSISHYQGEDQHSISPLCEDDISSSVAPSPNYTSMCSSDFADAQVTSVLYSQKSNYKKSLTIPIKNASDVMVSNLTTTNLPNYDYFPTSGILTK